MLVHVIAHEGCSDTVGESALKVDSGRKIPCRTGESNLRQRRGGPTLYQLSYIPAPYCDFYGLISSFAVGVARGKQTSVCQFAANTCRAM